MPTSPMRAPVRAPVWRPISVERGFYVLRCAAAAAIAYQLAVLVGLPHPVWAPMSALVVSQGTATATLQSIWHRCLGTLAGAAAALLISWLGGFVGMGVTLQVAMAVALCATIAIEEPQLRVCLWTCPLLLTSGVAGPAAALVATSRVVEVILGAAVGGLLAAVSELLQARLCRAPPALQLEPCNASGTMPCPHSLPSTATTASATRI
jgi:uncharacterized membrane protein YccC